MLVDSENHLIPAMPAALEADSCPRWVVFVFICARSIRFEVLPNYYNLLGMSSQRPGIENSVGRFSDRYQETLRTSKSTPDLLEFHP